MKSLLVVTIVLGLLVVPAGVVLVGTAGTYLTTTRDIVTLRFNVVSLQQPTEPAGGYQRTLPGPDVTLRLFGVDQTALTLVEVNFDLEWQGKRLARSSQLVNLPIPRGAATTLTAATNLEPEHADEARALFARGDPDLLLVGRARLRLPNSSDGVWLNLRGPVRVALTGYIVRCSL